jgi:nucleoid-associated protein YgaU
VTPPRQPTAPCDPGREAKADGHAYVVRAGDTLSTIAERRHVTGGWRSLYEHNREVVGADPDMIRPGQQLSL